MFKNNQDNEVAIMKAYRQNVRKTKISIAWRLELRKRGAFVKNETRHLDRKINKCYPRGPAFLKVIHANSLEWLTSK
jgi:hypothetical protein